MSRIKKPVLNEKHLKALALIEQGQLTLRKVAEACGWQEDYLYELTSGDTSKAGEVASYFKAEYKKIGSKRNAKIKDLLKKNTELAHEMIQKILRSLDSQTKLSVDDRKLVATYMNALAKSTPNVQIDKLSYSYTKGYSPEQMIYEFKRLESLAGGTSQRDAVSKSKQGEPRSLLESLESRSGVAGEPEDTEL